MRFTFDGERTLKQMKNSIGRAEPFIKVLIIDLSRRNKAATKNQIDKNETQAAGLL